ncbi:MAG: ribose-phosphate pyrophosphokinase [Fervidicoccaceae archaeon]
MSRDVVVIMGPQSWWLDESRVIEAFGEVEVSRAAHRDFPDGETYVRVDPGLVRGRRVLLLQSLAPPQDKSLWQLVLMADACRRAGAERLLALVPYLAYARQDKVFLPGEPVSVFALLEVLSLQGIRALFAVDVHSASVLRAFGGYAENVLATRALAEAAAGLRPENLVVLAPDAGALYRARSLAAILGAPHDYLEKRRDRVTGEVSVSPKSVDVSGRDVLIVDDIISTGGTVARAAAMMLERGAKSVRVVASHALMCGGARERLREAGVAEVHALDTLPPVEGVVYHSFLREAAEAIERSGLLR